MDSHVEKSAVLLDVRFRRPFDWLGKFVLVENAQRAVALGYQQSAVREKSKTERRVHITREHFHFDSLFLGGDDVIFRIRDISWLGLEIRRGRSDEGNQLKDLLIRQLLRRKANHAFFRNPVPNRIGDFLVVGAIEPFLIEEPWRATRYLRRSVAAGTCRGEECRARVTPSAAASTGGCLSRSRRAWSLTARRSGLLLWRLARLRLRPRASGKE